MKDKSIIIMLLYVIFIGIATAQYSIKELPLYDNFRLVSLEYENASGEKALTNFEYDDKNFIVKALWQLNDNTRSGIVTFKYDEYGNIIEKNRVFSDSVTIHQTFEYDQKAKLIIDNFERSDGTVGKVSYKYGDDYRLLSAGCDKQNGWFTGKIIYEYDNEGNLLKGVLYQQEEGVGTINYFHNDKGLLIEENWDFPNIWNQTFDYKYKEVN